MNEYRSEKICKYLCALSCCSFAFSLFFQVTVSNSTALKGKDFIDLHARKEDLEKELAYLEFEESNLSSLNNIELRAYSIGFVKMTEPLASIDAPPLASLYSR